MAAESTEIAEVTSATSSLIAEGLSSNLQAIQEFWLVNFILNLLGYAVLILPG